ncbi:MAG: DUF2167 domain-containing protein [Ideonella sp. MAG2]|nr:MAG: DUF2167 domain-containing protein [Ideonella sp. MAG2]
MKPKLLGLLTALVTFCTSWAQAQGMSQAEQQRIFADAEKAAQAGPADLALAAQAHLKLPPGHTFVPQPHAQKMLNAMGNPGSDPRLQGLIFPKGEGQWFMTVRFESAGYIKDDDAKEWNADDLLKSYKEGTEAANKERTKMGVPALEILGWAQPPQYDAGTHRLAWAMSSREKGAPATTEQGVNYNTYVLGREGYFTMNLVTDLKSLDAHKPAAHTMLAALNFDDGKRYADFNPSTDKVAEYGLAALVVGAAAKKLGLLATLGLFLAKFWKIAVIGLAFLGAPLLRLFRRGDKA